MLEYNGISLIKKEFNVIKKIEEWVEEPLKFDDFYSNIEPPNCFYAIQGRIRDLIISSNKMNLPLEIFSLDALEVLVIIETPIKMLPYEISKLTSLEILLIENCDELTELFSLFF